MLKCNFSVNSSSVNEQWITLLAGWVGVWYYGKYMQNVRVVTVVKQGSSVGVIIPAHICRELGIERGDQMSLVVFAPGVLAYRKLTEAEILQLKPPVIHV